MYLVMLYLWPTKGVQERIFHTICAAQLCLCKFLNYAKCEEYAVTSKCLGNDFTISFRR